MKKTILILLVLVLATFSLTASIGDKSIIIKAPVEGFTVFGVSSEKVIDANFKTQALFESAVKTSVEKEINILALKDAVDVGYLSAINNRSNKVSLYISTSNLVSGSNTIAIKVMDNYEDIPASANSKYGTLKNTLLQIKETVPGAAALAPAGRYEATVTISLTSTR